MVLRQLSGVLIGVAAAVLGLLPWLVTGAHLPLQNLWATATADAAAMPVVLLPFSQYAVLLIVALLVTGGTAAGLVVRSLPGRRVGIVLGLLAVQLLTVVQSAIADGAGLQHTTIARLYLALLVATGAASLVLSALVVLLVGIAPRAGLVVGVAIAAVPLGDWAASLLVPFGSISVNPVASALLVPLRFLPAAVIGAAIAWAGLRSAGRIVAAVVALLLLWIGPALETGVVNSAGTRVYAHDPAAMLEAGRTVFVLALFSADVVVAPLLLALVVVLLGTVVGVLLRRRRTVSATG